MGGRERGREKGRKRVRERQRVREGERRREKERLRERERDLLLAAGSYTALEAGSSSRADVAITLQQFATGH